MAVPGIDEILRSIRAKEALSSQAKMSSPQQNFINAISNIPNAAKQELASNVTTINDSVAGARNTDTMDRIYDSIIKNKKIALKSGNFETADYLETKESELIDKKQSFSDYQSAMGVANSIINSQYSYIEEEDEFGDWSNITTSVPFYDSPQEFEDLSKQVTSIRDKEGNQMYDNTTHWLSSEYAKMTNLLHTLEKGQKNNFKSKTMSKDREIIQKIKMYTSQLDYAMKQLIDDDIISPHEANAIVSITPVRTQEGYLVGANEPYNKLRADKTELSIKQINNLDKEALRLRNLDVRIQQYATSKLYSELKDKKDDMTFHDIVGAVGQGVGAGDLEMSQKVIDMIGGNLELSEALNPESGENFNLGNALKYLQSIPAEQLKKIPELKEEAIKFHDYWAKLPYNQKLPNKAADIDAEDNEALDKTRSFLEKIAGSDAIYPMTDNVGGIGYKNNWPDEFEIKDLRKGGEDTATNVSNFFRSRYGDNPTSLMRPSELERFFSTSDKKVAKRRYLKLIEDYRGMEEIGDKTIDDKTIVDKTIVDKTDLNKNKLPKGFKDLGPVVDSNIPQPSEYAMAPKEGRFIVNYPMGSDTFYATQKHIEDDEKLDRANEIKARDIEMFKTSTNQNGSTVEPIFDSTNGSVQIPEVANMAQMVDKILDIKDEANKSKDKAYIVEKFAKALAQTTTSNIWGSITNAEYLAARMFHDLSYDREHPSRHHYVSNPNEEGTAKGLNKVRNYVRRIMGGTGGDEWKKLVEDIAQEYLNWYNRTQAVQQ